MTILPLLFLLRKIRTAVRSQVLPMSISLLTMKNLLVISWLILLLPLIRARPGLPFAGVLTRRPKRYRTVAGSMSMTGRFGYCLWVRLLNKVLFMNSRILLRTRWWRVLGWLRRGIIFHFYVMGLEGTIRWRDRSGTLSALPCHS